MTTIYRDPLLLHPKVRGAYVALSKELILAYETGLTKTRFELFEGYRSFERQNDLFAVGTTKARGGQSAHNFGLACDFVPLLNNGGNNTEWSWSERHDWAFLAKVAAEAGFENQTAGLRWDKPHVQVPGWRATAARSGSWI